MKLFLPFLSLLLLNTMTTAQSDFPSTTISNEQLEAKVYLPDAKNGYYRSTRFDWAGVIGSLQFKGHEYFGNWLPEHNPLNPESISGPVEAFYPVGYEDGDTFLVIGIGMLRKLSNKPYHFMDQYEIVDGGQWEVQSGDYQVRMIHTLNHESGYAYEYTKTIRLADGEPKMILEHQLKNIGEKPLETTVYNHNFFIIDGETTDPNITTAFSYDLEVKDGKGFGEKIVAHGNRLVYKTALQKGEYVFTPNLKGYGSTADDYDIRIENVKSGAGVHITADRPLLKMIYWASHTTACPEPYIQIDAAPGEEFTWDIGYEFYVLD
ncbi:hypothetical protein [Tunicatimonas pelagia]|uniref:hypothetical protein n=1 Tax=Tunicatimonas pelagia TaxID=931531 RepID=UPI00266657DC|nr:hypothetical protein [Tunicatimonas pelagia]WKN46163.1 hypothetical protein P0M28_14510 [Tunicatimonas pelagia]